MPQGLKKILVSSSKVVGSVLLGMLLVMIVSMAFPRLLSAYGIFGIILNVLVGLLILSYAEVKEVYGHQQAIRSKVLMTSLVLVSLFAAIVLQLWMYIELMDSNMSSSQDGVMMRVEGKLTVDGWLNIFEFTLLIPLVAAVIGLSYQLFQRV